MRYLSVLILICCISMGSAAALSQEQRTDFSGRWSLNQEKSDLGVDRTGKPRKPRAAEMIVEQDDKELKVTMIRINNKGKKIETKMKYALDGSVAKNKTEFGKQESVVRWMEEGRVLEIASDMEIKRETRQFNVEMVQNWSIVEGSLVIKLSRYSEMGEMSHVAVYDRVKEVK